MDSANTAKGLARSKSLDPSSNLNVGHYIVYSVRVFESAKPSSNHLETQDPDQNLGANFTAHAVKSILRFDDWFLNRYPLGTPTVLTTCDRRKAGEHIFTDPVRDVKLVKGVKFFMRVETGE